MNTDTKSFILDFFSDAALEPLVKARASEPSASDADNSEVSKPVDFDEIITKSYTNAWHLRCIEIKAAVLFAKMELSQAARDFLTEAVSDEWDTLEEFLSQVATDYYMTGNAYVESENDNLYRPVKLHNIPPASMLIKRDSTAFKKRRYVQSASKEIPFTAFGDKASNTIVHFRKANALSAYYGYPGWLPSIEALGLDKNLKLFLASFFGNGAIPALAAILQGGEWDDGSKAKFTETMRKIKGAKGAFSTLVVSVPFENAKLELKELTSPLKDFDFEKLQKPLREEILAAHGMPPRLVGVITAGQLGGAGDGDAQLRTFYETNTSPDQRMFESKFNRILKAAGIADEMQLSTPDDLFTAIGPLANPLDDPASALQKAASVLAKATQDMEGLPL